MHNVIHPTSTIFDHVAFLPHCSKIGLTIDAIKSLILWPYLQKTTAFPVKKKTKLLYSIYVYVYTHNIITQKCHYCVHASVVALI